MQAKVRRGPFVSPARSSTKTGPPTAWTIGSNPMFQNRGDPVPPTPMLRMRRRTGPQPAPPKVCKDLPATRLKIDQTFISRIETSATDRAIVSTITHLAHALDMRVVAEGVETEAQFRLLRAAGCDEVQGFLTGRPLSVKDLHQLFSSASTQIRTGTR